ncbi:MAG: alpha-L-fucosidase [Kiritimatiellales bacterium]|nr:alpha-L-fucosidase [Kiritimatiellales bacterium]
MTSFKLLVAIAFLSMAAMTESAPLPIARGSFEPTWDSLKAYECPEWFQDAKFGIWAHWGPQSVPELGDDYAREMYVKGSEQNKYHIGKYGQPSVFGFKDVCNEWKADQFDPKKLITLYKKAGAQYFVMTASGSDNFDNWNSRSQTWNATAVGPKKDLVALWEDAARNAGLRFGVSVHSAKAWKTYEVAKQADGELTRADGKGLWWQGYDPQALYAQKHSGPAPDASYCRKFYYRMIDLISAYRPDLLCFDDDVLPLQEAGEEYGLSIAAHLYNSSMTWHPGGNESVMSTRKLGDAQRECLTRTRGEGSPDRVELRPWQMDASIGDGYYNQKHSYKTATEIIKMLVDVVSKNGNLLLNIPIRANGTIDADEEALLEKMAVWMEKNGECVFKTRPWKIHGEGENLRFTTKGDVLYVVSFNWPQSGVLKVRTLAKGAAGIQGDVTEVNMLGGWGKMEFKREKDALSVTLPKEKPCKHAFVFKIKGIDLAASTPVAPKVQIQTKPVVKKTPPKKPGSKGKKSSSKGKQKRKQNENKKKPVKKGDMALVPRVAARKWRVVSVDSVNADKVGENVFDGDHETIWHTQREGKKPKHPHQIVIDLGKVQELVGFTQLTRHDGMNGSIADYEFYVSLDNVKWKKVSAGKMEPSKLNKVLFKSPEWALYIKLVALSEHGEMKSYTSIAELDILTKSSGPTPAAKPAATVAPQKDGSIVLTAKAAVMHGKGVKMETKSGGLPNIGHWTKHTDWVSWKIKVPKAGNYEVSILYAQEKGTSEFNIKAEKKPITVKTKNTGSWESFKPVTLGKIRVAKAGAVEITIKPKNKKSWKPMNIRSVTLKPVK